MPDHIFEKRELIRRLEACLGKTFEMIDNKGMFDHVQKFKLQKGIVGTVVEQCVFGYPPDSKQEADLIIIDRAERVKTELKTTGMVLRGNSQKHYVAKEPMSITAVGVYDIGEQEFETSHFWEKLEHMLIIYYHYTSAHSVSAYDYKNFPMVGYEFHEFSSDDVETLKKDWEYVRSLCAEVVSHHSGPRDKSWKDAVKQEYIDVHGQLRRVLSYIDLAPKFPPRFRLKQAAVSAMITKHFRYELEQLPGRYVSISDIDLKCKELTTLYAGQAIGQLISLFNLEYLTDGKQSMKSVAEKIVIAMFGGTAKKLNQIELFEKFGLIGKTITFSLQGGRTEDMKLYHMDFSELTRETVVDDEGVERPITFEDSEMYSYFAEHEFLCIMFKENSLDIEDSMNSLASNIFIGFKRIVFSDGFIDTKVRKLWEDTRDKVMNHKLTDVIQMRGDGGPVILKSGEVSSAPNFLKGSENDIFLRGSGIDSSLKHKTECVNGIHMLPQYVWIKGASVIEELNRTPEV